MLRGKFSYFLRTTNYADDTDEDQYKPRFILSKTSGQTGEAIFRLGCVRDSPGDGVARRSGPRSRPCHQGL